MELLQELSASLESSIEEATDLRIEDIQFAAVKAVNAFGRHGAPPEVIGAIKATILTMRPLVLVEIRKEYVDRAIAQLGKGSVAP